MLTIAVGGSVGGDAAPFGFAGGGGGGTFVALSGAALFIAGGGGGAGQPIDNGQSGGQAGASGAAGANTANAISLGAGGANGAGGSANSANGGGGGGGGGFLTNGGSNGGGGGASFANGLGGGFSISFGGAGGAGGFGGGGGVAFSGSGGGGGYSGGGGSLGGNGGGGGSFNAGLVNGDRLLASGVNRGNGFATVELIASAVTPVPEPSTYVRWASRFARRFIVLFDDTCTPPRRVPLGTDRPCGFLNLLLVPISPHAERRTTARACPSGVDLLIRAGKFRWRPRQLTAVPAGRARRIGLYAESRADPHAEARYFRFAASRAEGRLAHVRDVF